MMRSSCKEVVFYRWVDPLLNLIRQYEDDEFRYARDTFGTDEVDYPQKPAGFHGPLLAGPGGLIPLEEGNCPSKLYNFFIGHTNFDLTPSDVDRISLVRGVETLEIYTRYRFRVGIGKLFKEGEVKEEIRRVLCTEYSRLTGFEAVKSYLKNTYNCFAIWKMPDNHYEYAGGDSIEEVIEKGKAFTQGKQVYLSWGVKGGSPPSV